MALPTASDNEFPKVILEEVATDGSATVTPAADHRAVFLGEDGALYAKDSAGAVTALGGDVAAHTGDTTDAHDGTAISFADSGSDYTATDVDAALTEVMDAHLAHLADAADAHDATAISFAPAGTIAATTVQAAIEEVASEAGGGGSVSDDVKQRANAYMLELDWSAGKYQDGGLVAATHVNSSVWTGYIYFTPLYVPKAITVDRIGINAVSGAAAGDEVRMGIYESGADGFPGALLLDAGTVAYSTNGGKEITISQALSADTVYWLALTVNAGVSGNSFGCHAPTTAAPYYMASLTQAGYFVIVHRASFAYAALPNPAGTIALETTGGIGGGIPSIRVRVA